MIDMRIFRKIIICGFMAILVFFLGVMTSYAETTANYSSVRLDVYQCKMDVNVHGLNPVYYDCVWDNRTGTGSNAQMSFGSTNGHLQKIQSLIFGGSNVFPAGSYNLSVQLAINPREMLHFTDIYTYRIFGNTSSSTNGASSGIDTISSYTCSASQVSGSNYRVDINCTFNTTKDLKFLMISMEAKTGTNAFGLGNTSAIQTEGITRFSYSIDSTGAINNQTTIIQSGFNDIDSTLNDDDIDNPNSMISDFEDLLPQNGVITQLIALPINLYQKVLNSINGTCQSFNLGSLYGTNIILPCIELTDILGSTLVNTIDLLMSGFFILHIAKKMIKAFESFTSMKEGDVIDD